MIQDHPIQNSEVRKYLEDVMTQLETALSVDELAAALERGKALDLDTVVQELLAEFGKESVTED